MLEIAYKRGNLVFQAVGCFALAAGGGWLAFQDWAHWQLRLLGSLFAVGLPFVSYALAHRVISGQSAITEINGGLRLSTLYESTDLCWQDLQSIEREVLTQASALGLIKQDIAHYLVFSSYSQRDGEFRIKIQEDLIDIPKSGRDRLYRQLLELWKNDGSPPPVAASQIASPALARRAPTFGRRGI